MRPPTLLRPAGASLAALSVALVPLLLLGGRDRTSGFRLAAVLLGGFALRAIVRSTSTANAAPLDSPFAPPKRRMPLRRRRAVAPPRTPVDALVVGGVERAGHFHYRLRPALREIAAERLEVGHGLTIDDPRAALLLGPEAWDHLRADRPAPEDRRAPGPPRETVAAILSTLESL